MVPVLACGCGAADSRSGDGAPPARPSWFTERTTEAGLGFVHVTGHATGSRRLPEIMGGGVAMLDADGDGRLDLYLVDGGLDPSTGAPDDRTPNRLLLQRADGSFDDVTGSRGAGGHGYGMGVAVGDVDNDGHPDLYLANFGPDQLLRNRGDGTFEDVTASAGVDVPGWSCSATFLDYDRDGFLDLYVTQYVVFDPDVECLNRAGQPIYCGPLAFRPVPDVLLRNAGDGGFTDVSDSTGIASVACAGLGVVAADLDDDGWVDLYVANDAYANQLWRNGGDGRFTDVAVMLGVAFNLHGQPEAGMGVVAADMENRGLNDLLVTHLVGETNTLYRRLEGDLAFADATGRSRLGPSSMPLTGFGVCALDVELDGDLDVAIVNGRVRRDVVLEGAADLGDPWRLLAEPNLLYVNDGAGRFTLALDEAGTMASRVEVTRGLAMGDVDDDGDVDLLLGNVAGPARLYRNDAPRQGRWLSVRAVDPALRRDAIGARVVVATADGRRLMRTVNRGSSYLSSSDARAHFGLGAVDGVASVEIRWPDGLTERFAVDGVDASITLERGTGEPVS